jgi:hypothetical protein
MSVRKEGAGLRAIRTPNRGSLRAKLLSLFMENPQLILTRQEIIERFPVKISALDLVVNRLKQDGHIKSLMGPRRFVSYASTSLPEPKKIKPALKTKANRDWSSSSTYVAPKAIPISIFDYARTL